MSGAVLAALSGVGFGLFQALNGRAVRDLSSVYWSTFLQTVLATVVLGVAAALVDGLGALGDLPLNAIALFVAAGLAHFFVGWTTLSLSHRRIGAARTGPLLSTTPLFGLALAAVISAQFPGAAALAGIALMVAGAYLVAAPPGSQRDALAETGFAFMTAGVWALSAVLIFEGLEHVDTPVLGVAVGVAAAALAYGLLLLLVPGTRSQDGMTGIWWKLAAGLVVALATWGRWAALDEADVAVVLALNLLSVPLVLVLSPLVSGRAAEPVTGRLWAGAALVVAGSLTLVLVN